MIEIFQLINLFFRVFLAQFGQPSENFGLVFQEEKDFFLVSPIKNVVSLITVQAFFLVIFLDKLQVLLVGCVVDGKKLINKWINHEPDLDFVFKSPWITIHGPFWKIFIFPVLRFLIISVFCFIFGQKELRIITFVNWNSDKGDEIDHDFLVEAGADAESLWFMILGVIQLLTEKWVFFIKENRDGHSAPLWPFLLSFAAFDLLVIRCGIGTSPKYSKDVIQLSRETDHLMAIIGVFIGKLRCSVEI